MPLFDAMTVKHDLECTLVRVILVVVIIFVTAADFQRLKNYIYL